MVDWEAWNGRDQTRRRCQFTDVQDPVWIALEVSKHIAMAKPQGAFLGWMVEAKVTIDLSVYDNTLTRLADEDAILLLVLEDVGHNSWVG